MGWWDLEGGPLEKNWLKGRGGDAAANQLSRLAGLLTSFMLEILAYNALVTYIAFQDYNVNGDIDRFFDLTTG